MEEVWVLTALFTGDNNDNRLEVVGVYKAMYKAIEEMINYHESTKEAWMKEGIEKDEILDIRHAWICTLKVKNSHKQAEFNIYREIIDNE